MLSALLPRILCVALACAGIGCGIALAPSAKANNDGVMHFRLTPQDGTPINVRVALEKKTYKIEIDDEEDVLVKKREGPDFTFELVESTVKGTRVNIDRE